MNQGCDGDLLHAHTTKVIVLRGFGINVGHLPYFHIFSSLLYLLAMELSLAELFIS